MDRRRLLHVLGGSAALAGLTPGQLDALLAPGAPRRPSAAFFTAEQREAMTALADRVIPATDTPGAVEAGVVEYAELIVSEWMEAEERERFMRGLAHVDVHTVASLGVRFAHAAPDQQDAILRGLEAEALAMAEAEDAPEPFFTTLKGLVLHGYYTSEIGMREELRFRPIPGRFDGCAPLTEVTRAAASEGGG